MTKHSSEHRHQKAVGQTTVKVEFFLFPFTCQLVPPYIVYGLLLQCVPCLLASVFRVVLLVTKSADSWSEAKR